MKKKGSEKCRRWLLTLPVEVYSREEVEEKLGKYDAYIGQREKGEETGYEHWQVYLEHASGIRFMTLKSLFPKGHLEQAKGTPAQAVEYVTKEETSLGERIEHGHIDITKKQGQRSDLVEMHEAIMAGTSVDELLINDPRALRYGRNLRDVEAARDNAANRSMLRDVKAFYLYGAPRVGKTMGVLTTYGLDDIYRVSTYKNPFDGYRSQGVLVLDEFASQPDLGLLLNILDGYPLELPCRYQNRWAAFSRVWVVSNLPLERQYEEVQQSDRVRWEALRARFAGIYEMRKDGVRTVAGSPYKETILTELDRSAAREETA